MKKKFIFIVLVFSISLNTFASRVTRKVKRPAVSQLKADNKDVDELDAKRKQVVDLVEKAADYLRHNETMHSFSQFTHSKEFRYGDLYLFAYTTDGFCVADGESQQFVWENNIHWQNKFGDQFIKNLIQKGLTGGGWVTYQWRNAIKNTYVKEVKKGGVSYILGCGFYPHSKRDAVINLVETAVELFNELKSLKRPKEQAFSIFNYPDGKFVFGSLYLFALDFEGNIMAMPTRPQLVGLNDLTYLDASGKTVTRDFTKDIIAKLEKTPDEGVWVNYTYDNAEKRTYARRVQDEQGKNYLIACGYYPFANRDAAVSLVKKGYVHLKGVGKSQAFESFTNRINKDFRYGDLFLIVFDMTGKCVAHGLNDELIGKDFYNQQDENGQYYVREIIEKAKSGGGWVEFKTKNTYESMYVEEVNLGLPENHFVIGCGFFPINKEEAMDLLIKSAAGYMKINQNEIVFGEFSNLDGKYIIGDLDITVLDSRGLCYVAGLDKNLIWQNFIELKDDDGKSFVQDIIQSALQNNGKISYKWNKVEKIAYIEKIIKNKKTYIVYSSFTK